jgi:hypothetical protein
MLRAAWFVAVSVAWLGCGTSAAAPRALVPDVSMDEALGAAQRVVAAEGYSLGPIEKGDELATKWRDQGHRSRRAVVAVAPADGTTGVSIEVRVEERRRTPSDLAEPATDLRASSRLLSAIAEAAAEPRDKR